MFTEAYHCQSMLGWVVLFEKIITYIISKAPQFILESILTISKKFSLITHFHYKIQPFFALEWKIEFS